MCSIAWADVRVFADRDELGGHEASCRALPVLEELLDLLGLLLLHELEDLRPPAPWAAPRRRRRPARRACCPGPARPRAPGAIRPARARVGSSSSASTSPACCGLSRAEEANLIVVRELADDARQVGRVRVLDEVGQSPVPALDEEQLDRFAQPLEFFHEFVGAPRPAGEPPTGCGARDLTQKYDAARTPGKGIFPVQRGRARHPSGAELGEPERVGQTSGIRWCAGMTPRLPERAGALGERCHAVGAAVAAPDENRDRLPAVRGQDRRRRVVSGHDEDVGPERRDLGDGPRRGARAPAPLRRSRRPRPPCPCPCSGRRRSRSVSQCSRRVASSSSKVVPVLSTSMPTSFAQPAVHRVGRDGRRAQAEHLGKSRQLRQLVEAAEQHHVGRAPRRRAGAGPRSTKRFTSAAVRFARGSSARTGSGRLARAACGSVSDSRAAAGRRAPRAARARSGAPSRARRRPRRRAAGSRAGARSRRTHISVLMRPARRSVMRPAPSTVQKFPRAATSPARRSNSMPSASRTPRPT